MHLARGNEREDVIPLPQPAVDLLFQHGSALTGAPALAVYHADAQLALARAGLDEFGEPGFRLGDRHSVQVDLGLHAEAATGEFAHGALADSGTMEAQALTAVALRIVDVRVETLSQDGRLIRPRETCLRCGLANDFLRPPGRTQWFRVGKGAAEKIWVIVCHGIAS